MLVGKSTIKRIFKEGSDIKNVRVSDDAIVVIHDSLVEVMKELGECVCKETKRKTIQPDIIQKCVDKHMVMAGMNSYSINNVAPDRKTTTCDISENSARNMFNEGCPIKKGKEGYRMNGVSLRYLCILAEFYLLKLSKETSVMAKHARRQTITSEDVLTFLEIRNRIRNDYNFSRLGFEN